MADFEEFEDAGAFDETNVAGVEGFGGEEEDDIGGEGPIDRMIEDGYAGDDGEDEDGMHDAADYEMDAEPAPLLSAADALSDVGEGEDGELEEREDADELAFPKEFEDVDFFSNADVAVLLGNVRDKADEERESGKNVVLSTAFLDAERYVQRFGGRGIDGRALPELDRLRDALRSMRFPREGGKYVVLHEFTAASLCNLNPPTVEIAREQIGSLQDFHDEEIRQMLDELQRSNAALMGS